MALTVGDRLAHYDVTALIGEGGMGQVYRATDTQLRRDVALKILPDTFAADPDRLARFQREAQVLASLNHPNIAQIHGVEKSDDTQALVLELVDGPTLADRIAKGPIPLDEALPIAKQIAEALEAAHEAGVIHRDLKPANIKVREDGTVKVLDFGLAKALDTTSEGDPSQSPTLTAAATQMGVIMGTAAYMSPEQARGKPVDKRADIWAFGAVLFEMLSGRRGFAGRDVSETLAGVIKSNPTWEWLPPDLPSTLHGLLRRCLTKDAQQRLRDIGDARLAMEESFDVIVPQTGDAMARHPQVWQRPVPAAIVAVALLVIGGVTGWGLLRPAEPASRHASRFVLNLGPTDLLREFAVSPNGRELVYVALRDGVPQLFRRSMNRLEVVPIDGTEGAELPFFSSDSRSVAFFTASALKVVPLARGAPITLCPIAGTRRGADWLSDGTIVFSYDGAGGFLRISSAGGMPQPVTTLTSDAREEPWRWPDVLPDGSAVLFTLWTTGLETAQIAVQPLEGGEPKVLLAGTNPRYVPTGHLVFARENSIWVAPFDADRLEVVGEVEPLVDRVQVYDGGLAMFALSDEGSLMYFSGEPVANRTLVWVDREGREEPVPGVPPGNYRTVRVSPDGTRLAMDDCDWAGNCDVWTYERARGTPTRLTTDRATDTEPLWTMDNMSCSVHSARDRMGCSGGRRTARGALSAS